MRDRNKLIWMTDDHSSPKMWAEIKFYGHRNENTFMQVEVFQQFYVKERHIIERIISEKRKKTPTDNLMHQVYRNVGHYSYKIERTSHIHILIAPFCENQIPNKVMQDALNSYIYMNFTDPPPIKPIEDNWLKIHFRSYYDNVMSMRLHQVLQDTHAILNS